jgi:hypothetical protein
MVIKYSIALYYSLLIKKYLNLFKGLWGVGDAVWQTQINGNFFVRLIHLVSSDKVTHATGIFNQ